MPGSELSKHLGSKNYKFLELSDQGDGYWVLKTYCWLLIFILNTVPVD
jgi:hypothetical protein